MYSILFELDKYFKSKGIKFRKIKFNYSCLPEYINHAILYILRGLDSKDGFSMGVEYYSLSYDENGVLHFEVFTDKADKRLLICNNPLGFSTKIPSYVISEKRLMEYALILASHRNLLLYLRNELMKKYPDKSYKERLMEEYRIISSIVLEEISLRSDKDESILKEVDLRRFNERVLNDIITSVEDTIAAYSETSRKDDQIEIIFLPGEKNREDNGVLRLGKNAHSKDRISEVIPKEEREAVLKSFPCIFSGNAVSYGEYLNLDYMCYLYKCSRDKFVLILEPSSGINYTRIVVINSRNYLERGDFVNLVAKYLEMPSEEFVLCENAIRTTHKTIDLFRRNISCAVLGEDKCKGSKYAGSYVRKKIRDIRMCDKKEIL